MKIIVYSVNIGGYDEFREPTIYDPNIRYILFTDNKYYKSNIWEICHTDFLPKNLDNRKKARYVKLNPHIVLPNHDVSIWVDHCYTPRFKSAVELLKEINFNNDIMCYRHNIRNCTYDESKVVINDKLEYPNVVNQQMNKYREDGFPRNYGLFDSGFTIRKNSKDVIRFNNIWWNEISNHSGRDQLSQMYSSWKSNVGITPIRVGSSIYNNKFLSQKIKHPKKWSIT
jgi:hypothetical protein